MDGGERGVDGERRLGQQAAHALEQVGALDAAVQVQVRLVAEARLLTQVQDGLRSGKVLMS